MNPTPPASRSLLLATYLLLCVAGLMIAIHLGGLSGEAMCRADGCRVYEHSHFYGWSIASIGVHFYGTMLGLWAGFVGVKTGHFRRAMLGIAVLIDLFAFVISLILVKVQLFGFAPICPWCLASAGICVAIWLIAVILFRRANWPAQPLASAAVLAMLVLIGFRGLSTENVVAKIGNQTISRTDMENAIGFAGRRAEWETYRAEKDWLDQKLTDMLIEREAAARHITTAAIVQAEFNDPVNRQVEAFMQKNAGNLKPEDAAVVRQEVRTQFKADRAEAFVSQLMKKYGAVEYLQIPLVDEKDLAALPGWHRGGDTQTASIRLVIFSDFACEYCAHTAKAIDSVMKRYGNQISLTFHVLPLDIHPRGQEAALAAECAAEQNKFWPYHDALMSHGGRLGGIDFIALAGQLGLDPQKFRECSQNNQIAEKVNQSKQQANAFGIDATPAVFLNGQRIGGDLSDAALQNWIERLTSAAH